MKNILIITILNLLVVSCSYNKEELVIEPEPGNGGSGGNIPTITYTSHAKAIIDSKCTTCHSSNPIDFQQVPFLTSYSLSFDKKDRIQSRALDLMTMPISSSSTGLLTQTEKDTLQMWIDQGALE